MKIKAYPKVNLGLKIYKDKKQSKHKIDSIFCLYKKLYNQIEIVKSKTLSIKYIYKIQKPKFKEELIHKVLNYLHSKYKWDINYKITITKNIPLGSGLGGSSSEAGAIIDYLSSKNKPVKLDLKQIALELGSDIPFFISKQEFARVKEFGNKIETIKKQKPKFIVYLNNFDCQTSKIFASLDADKKYNSKVNINQLLNKYLYKQHNNVVYNDLTKYIILNDSKLAKLYNSFGVGTFFSGSGSTIIKLKEK